MNLSGAQVKKGRKNCVDTCPNWNGLTLSVDVREFRYLMFCLCDRILYGDNNWRVLS